MKRFYESLTGWGTVVGSSLIAISLAVTLIVYVVRMDEGILHCTRAIDRQEGRLDTISDNVAKTREEVAKLQGELRPLQAAIDR